MLWIITVVLVAFWLLGYLNHFGGRMIHILLAVAAVVLVVNVLSGRSSV
jgi:hypothetical protein